MRTTLDLDDDVLAAAKALAAHQGMTAGQVVSALVRKGLEAEKTTARVRNGVPLFPSTPGRIVTPTMVEDVLEWYARLHGFHYACLRYFNASGGTPERGEDHTPETHLVPIILQVALGQRASIAMPATTPAAPS